MNGNQGILSQGKNPAEYAIIYPRDPEYNSLTVNGTGF